MITLIIEDFSCIQFAKLELAPVTVLIGPQGSGKSVTTKLTYFCQDILIRQYYFADKNLSLEDIQKDTARQFRLWFPPTAWGRKRFNINFQAGDFSVRILRRVSKGKPADDVSITFSDYFRSQYNELRQSYEKAKKTEIDDDEDLFRHSEALWKVRETSQMRLSKHLAKNYTSRQTFIPASRASFTSMGQFVAAFNQESSLDPLNIKFAKLFATLRDFASRGHLLRRRDHKGRKSFTEALFGGEIKFEKDSEYVQVKDGRIIPFNALSSGQQELLPMWLMVEFYADRRSDTKSTDLFYIEEPEAHLFPAAQAQLMDFLVSSLVSIQGRRHLVLTTHSPYILSTLNNYLKAGKLGSTRKNAAKVADVINRDLWLTPQGVRAYSLDKGKLVDIMDADGLIDATFIDGVSDQVGKTFSRLLDIEFPEENDE